MAWLEGRVALITGGGSGIGAATANLFAREGAAVCVADVVEANAQSVAESIVREGGRALAVTCDVTNKDQVAAMVQKTLQAFGRLDILINNAGINRDALLRKMSEEQWDSVIDVNLKGSFLCAQAAAEPMIEQKYGRIINTASIGALGNIGQANYAASKAGVIGLTYTLALELARYNITVNCVAPGATETAMTAGIPEDIKQNLLARIPARRMARPEEIAWVHLFFASEESAYITGQVLFVDGGITVGF